MSSTKNNDDEDDHVEVPDSGPEPYDFHDHMMKTNRVGWDSTIEEIDELIRDLRDVAESEWTQGDSVLAARMEYDCERLRDTFEDLLSLSPLHNQVVEEVDPEVLRRDLVQKLSPGLVRWTGEKGGGDLLRADLDAVLRQGDDPDAYVLAHQFAQRNYTVDVKLVMLFHQYRDDIENYMYSVARAKRNGGGGP